ncbi:hypothetical protein A2U01_0089018, partial [Trifolium medium]|nr:hypothetical protein [Trifolium medium]
MRGHQAQGETRPPRHSPRRDSPSHRYRRHHSPAEEERHRGPLSRRIMELPLPIGLEKPPPLDTYDGSTDPDDH